MPFQDSYIQQRSTAIESIETTIAELGQIFTQLANMVAEQRETVQRIDSDTHDIMDNVTGAQRELLIFYNSVSSNRWLILKIFGVLIVFVRFYLLFIVAPSLIRLLIVPYLYSCFMILLWTNTSFIFPGLSLLQATHLIRYPYSPTPNHENIYITKLTHRNCIDTGAPGLAHRFSPFPMPLPSPASFDFLDVPDCPCPLRIGLLFDSGCS
jgi:hypothetical protein